MTIKRTDIVQKIQDTASGTRITTLTYRTEPKLKKSCPFTNVRKLTVNTCMFGVNYENRLEKHGETPAGAAPFYVEVEGQNWLVKHPTTGDLYLRCSPTENNIPKSSYTSDQGPLTKDDLKDYFYAKKPQPHGPQVFTLGIHNLLKIKFNGVEYDVVD